MRGCDAYSFYSFSLSPVCFNLSWFLNKIFPFFRLGFPCIGSIPCLKLLARVDINYPFLNFFYKPVDLRGVDFPPFILLILFWKRKDIIKSFLAKLFVLSLYTVSLKFCNWNLIFFFLREKVFGRVWIKQVYITFLGTHFN